MGKAERVKATERGLKLRRMLLVAHNDPKSEQAARLKTIGGMSLADSVKGTKRQMAIRLSHNPILKQAVLHFGTRRQKRAAQRATRFTMRHEYRRAVDRERARVPAMVVIDDPYKGPSAAEVAAEMEMPPISKTAFAEIKAARQRIPT